MMVMVGAGHQSHWAGGTMPGAPPAAVEATTDPQYHP